MPHSCERTLTCDGVSIAYEVTGSGHPVVLVHGLGDDRSLFEPLIARLSEQYRCISLDLRGHGQSGSSADYNPLGLHRDLKAVTDALGITRPFLIGHSLGGVAVTCYAASHGALAVINIDQALEWSSLAALVRPHEAAIMGGQGPAFLMRVIEGIGAGPLNDALRARLQSTRAQLANAVVCGVWQPLFQHDDDQNAQLTAAAVRGIDRPYLALHGAAVTDEYASWLRQHVASADLEVWPAAGHFPHLVEPERFLQRAQAFFDDAST